jgi:hypothetical protein
MGTLLAALSLGMFALLACLLVGNLAVAHRVRSRHPGLWAELGNPTEWFTAATTTSGRHIFNYLDSRRYVETNDSQLIVLCKAVRYGWYVFFVAFVVTLAAWIGYGVSRNAI